MFFWWINSLRASYESHHIDWSIERSSDPSINRLLNLVHCFCHACILQHFFWVVFGFLMLYPSHPRILTSSHCVLSSSFEMIQNFIELQMAATFISGQGSLTKKETPSFRSECLKLWDVKCPPPSWANQLPNVLASKFWSHWDVQGRWHWPGFTTLQILALK